MATAELLVYSKEHKWTDNRTGGHVRMPHENKSLVCGCSSSARVAKKKLLNEAVLLRVVINPIRRRKELPKSPAALVLLSHKRHQTDHTATIAGQY